ncbi:MAG: AAA family ATPase [Anaerolineales bacterium]|nr:AAA family ATPase [Anaerolineales bacterium]
MDSFSFKTTAELPVDMEIVGQPRGVRAIEFGIGIQSHGYNIFVLGETGTGRATTIKRFLQGRTQDEATPTDWVYVHNFAVPHQPRAIALPAGQGGVFKQQMAALIQALKRDLPQAFDSDTYRDSIETVQQDFETRQGELLSIFRQQCAAAGFALVQTTKGFVIAPMQDGQPVPPEQLQGLTVEARSRLDAAYQDLSAELEDVLADVYGMEQETRQQMKRIDREVAGTAVQHHFDSLKQSYAAEDEALLYLNEVHEDVLNQIDDFAPPVDRQDEIDLRRYEVNLLVDQQQMEGAPVILESNPSYHGLFGRLEYEMNAGMLTTHFTNIKAGSLHRASGGYLLMNAHDLLKSSQAWEALKRALKQELIHVDPMARLETSQVLAKSLDPEPIPLQVKIVLIGSPGLYYALHEQDQDFSTLFKVRSDFDITMPRTPENELAYARFVANRCHAEGLYHFDASAVARVIEFGGRLADHQGQLSTQFGLIADLLREASYWAEINGRSTVTDLDVQQALHERTNRANRIEEETFELILDGTIFIATEGSVIGQVNGLSVIDTGEYAFGQPGRITARTFMGDEGLIHIEHETDMSGPIHHKGVLTLNGYLGGTYAQNQPLTMSASLTFEQTYVGIEGDSASSTELYALISSLSRVPLKQSIAVTGSVNQRGEIQPIGGVNEKIEGFFRLCKARGLTGDQGVLIPASNVQNLMLHEEVVTAVSANQFHIWPVHTIDEGIEILTGKTAGKRREDGSYPEGTLHCAVQTHLRHLAEELNKFGDSDDDD